MTQAGHLPGKPGHENCCSPAHRVSEGIRRLAVMFGLADRG